jgi:hypothetical protein
MHKNGKGDSNHKEYELEESHFEFTDKFYGPFL